MAQGSVSTTVRYLSSDWRNSDEIPRIGDRESRRANTSRQTVQIHDARQAGPFDLDANGFTLLRHRSRCTSFRDPAVVHDVYYPEIEALVRAATGADLVHFVQHVVRTEDQSDFNNAYARFLHYDYNVREPEKEARGTIDKAGIELAAGRNWEFAFYNTWQPIDRAVEKNPLALIAGDSIRAGDVIDYYYTGFGNDGIGSMPIFNPDHEFFYFPNMQPDELLLFKQLDTRADRVRACPHTSFDDPGSAPDAPGRRSIEVRVLCAFGS